MGLLTLSGIKQLNDRLKAQSTRVVDRHDMPLYPDALDTKRDTLVVADDTSGWSVSMGISDVDETVLFEGRPTRRIYTDGPASQPRYQFPETLDLSEYDYLDVWLRLNRRMRGGDTISIRFSDDDYDNERSHGSVHNVFRLEPPGVWVRYRLHLNSFSGTLPWTQINRVRFWVNTPNPPLEVHLAKIDAVSVRSAVMSMDFDDHHASVYDVAFPVMSSFGLKGAFYIITGGVGGPNRVTWDQLREMQSAGWLIGSHTHDHTNMGDVGVSDDHKLKVIRRARAILEQQGFPVGARFLALPYGALPNTEVVYDELERNYVMVRQTTSVEGPYRAVGNATRMNLTATTVGASTTVQDVKDRIDFAIEQKLMYRPLWHQLVPNPQDIEWDPDDFAEVCEYIADKRDAGELVVLDPYDMLVSDKGELIRTGGQDAILTHDGQSHVLIKLP